MGGGGGGAWGSMVRCRGVRAFLGERTVGESLEPRGLSSSVLAWVDHRGLLAVVVSFVPQCSWWC